MIAAGAGVLLALLFSKKASAQDSGSTPSNKTGLDLKSLTHQSTENNPRGSGGGGSKKEPIHYGRDNVEYFQEFMQWLGTALSERANMTIPLGVLEADGAWGPITQRSTDYLMSLIDEALAAVSADERAAASYPNGFRVLGVLDKISRGGSAAEREAALVKGSGALKSLPLTNADLWAFKQALARKGINIAVGPFAFTH